MHCGLFIPIFIFQSEILDSKAINDVTRTFLRNFNRVKSEQKQKLPSISSGANNTVDIDLREDLPFIRSDGVAFDISNIISQAIVENVQCKPWAKFRE